MTDKARYSRCVFTLNNYTDIDEHMLKAWCSTGAVRFLIYGYETAPTTGTPHLQGYFELHNAKSQKSIKKWLPKAKLIFDVKGTAEQNRVYCMKEHNGGFEFGKPAEQGSRNDIHELMKFLKSGATIDEVQDKYPREYLKYHKVIKEIIEDTDDKLICQERLQMNYNFTWHAWQQELITELQGVPHPRKVIWYADQLGNNGKSTLATYFADLGNAYIITGGTKNDIFYGYKKQPIVIFDLVRDFQDVEKKYIFDVMENFKNGRFFSGKYESRMKFFRVPHVVVLANFEPNLAQLSLLIHDRWDIRYI